MSDELKKQVAEKALSYIELDDDTVIGVGSGSTVNYFIDALAAVKHKINGVVAASVASEQRLKGKGIPVIALTSVSHLDVYVDGADEINHQKIMIKGGGGALTREKVIATVAKKFICIVHEAKRVKRLGEFPIAVEVLPLARSYVARELLKLGGSPEYRQGFVTDNGNIILDVDGLALSHPIEIEERIKLIPGVVENGLFAKRIADVVLVATKSGVIEG